MTPVTFEDFEVRYKKIREKYPTIKDCTVEGCTNPRDITEGLGVDTTCSYHRLLFDFWIYEVLDVDETKKFITDRSARRKAFSSWMLAMGKDHCDEIVLKMAQDKINWVT